MLTTRAKNKIIDDMNVGIDAIGAKLPGRFKSNNEMAAWKYYVASYLLKRATDKRNEAKQEAIEAGVIFDSDDPDQQRAPGTNEPVFMGEYVTIMLQVSKPRVILDQKALVAALIKRGVAKHIIGEALDAASHESKPGHQFTASLLTKEATENGK